MPAAPLFSDELSPEFSEELSDEDCSDEDSSELTPEELSELSLFLFPQPASVKISEPQRIADKIIFFIKSVSFPMI